MSRARAACVAAAAIGVLVCMSSSTGWAASLSLTSQRFTPYRTCVLTATPAGTTVVSDTTVRQGTPAGNFGTVTNVTVASAAGANQRTYLLFDLTSCVPVIPATATVRGAALRLFSTALPAVCRTVDIFRVTAAWTETGVTWNSQPFGTAINNPATASRTDSFDVGTPAGCENLTNNAYVTGADLTADVAAFVAGTATNRGWMLRDDVEGSATARTWTAASKDLGTLARAPQLIITYVQVP